VPRYLALDWDAGHVYLVDANVTKGVVKIEQALSWPEELPPGPGNAVAFGERLRDRLKDAGIAAAPLLVAVGRERVIIKDVKIPAVPAHEEPAVVRFQAMKELTESVEDLVIDYSTGDVPEPSGEKKAFVASLKRDQLGAAKTMAQAAGLKLAGITPRAFGAIVALRRTAQPAPEPGTAFAVLCVGEKGGEFVVARGEQIALVRQLSAAARTTDAALMGEIRRNLAVYAGQAGQQPVRALYVAEATGPTMGVADRLRDTLAVPVYAFDPLSGLADVPPGPRGGFVGPAGLMHLKARAAQLPINFVQPREPKPPRDPNKRALTWAAGIAAALVLVVGGLGYLRLSSQERKVKDLQAEKQQAEELRDGLAKDDQRSKALADWLKTDVVWLDELYDLTAMFPDGNKALLTKLTTKPNPSATSRNSRFAALMDLEGFATNDNKPLADFRAALTNDGYSTAGILPKAGSSVRGVNRMLFRQQWVANSIGVPKRPPAEYTRKLAVKNPPSSGDKTAERTDEKGAGPGGEQ
jgi:Tfp pilus assembly PilM family ATPase